MRSPRGRAKDEVPERGRGPLDFGCEPDTKFKVGRDDAKQENPLPRGFEKPAAEREGELVGRKAPGFGEVGQGAEED